VGDVSSWARVSTVDDGETKKTGVGTVSHYFLSLVLEASVMLGVNLSQEWYSRDRVVRCAACGCVQRNVF
jgi:hypothetical protein